MKYLAKDYSIPKLLYVFRLSEICYRRPLLCKTAGSGIPTSPIAASPPFLLPVSFLSVRKQQNRVLGFYLGEIRLCTPTPLLIWNNYINYTKVSPIPLCSPFSFFFLRNIDCSSRLDVLCTSQKIAIELCTKTFVMGLIVMGRENVCIHHSFESYSQ